MNSFYEVVCQLCCRDVKALVIVICYDCVNNY